jgi:hypothetical protein
MCEKIVLLLVPLDDIVCGVVRLLSETDVGRQPQDWIMKAR